MASNLGAALAIFAIRIHEFESHASKNRQRMDGRRGHCVFERLP